MKPHCNTYRLRQAEHPNISLRCPAQLPERAMSSGVPKSQPENQTLRNTPECIAARRGRLNEHPVCRNHGPDRALQAAKRLRYSFETRCVVTLSMLRSEVISPLI